MFCSPMASSIALLENIMVTFSRMLIVIGSIDLFLTYFRVMREMEVVYSVQHQNLNSGQHVPHPVKHASLSAI